jgi:small GTP-binding protein
LNLSEPEPKVNREKKPVKLRKLSSYHSKEIQPISQSTGQEYSMINEYQTRTQSSSGPQEQLRYGPFKLVLAGEGGTGKTSLLERVKFDRFSETYALTVGGDVVFLDLNVNQITTRIMCWDSAGQTQFSCIRQAFWKGMKGSIIVFDISWRGSFEAVHSWFYELQEIAPRTPFVLVGSKTDLEANRQISQEEAQALATELGALAYIETSAKTGTDATMPFEILIKHILLHQKSAPQRIRTKVT